MTPTEADRASFRFTGADLLRREGFAIWREVVGRTVLKLDLELLEGQPIHSEASVQTLPGLRLAKAAMSGVRMARMRHHLADSNDHLTLHICTAGTWRLSHRDQELCLDCHAATLVSNAEAATVTCSASTHTVCIEIPRKSLAPFVPKLEDRLMRAVPRDAEALQLLIGYIATLDTKGVPRAPELCGLVASHIRDLAALAIGADKNASELAQGPGVRAARLCAIKHEILENFDHHDLSITKVAARHAVTPRFIQRLFESEGMTFSKYLLEQRLACAHRLLSDPRHRGLTITAIAFDAGFGDLPYFNRAFRRRYGATPSDVRSSAKPMREL